MKALISENILFFFTVSKTDGEIKSFTRLKSSELSQNKEILKKFLTNFIKINAPIKENESYTFKTIFLSSMIIEGFFSQFSDNIFICIFNKDVDRNQRKLFFLHIFSAYKNLFLKFSKILDNDEKIFSLIFHELLLGPLIHNFDNAYIQLSKRLELVILDNTEYITSLLIDLNNKNIICDIGNLLEKNYKTSFIQFQNRKKIINELISYGLFLKTNYIKSSNKNLDKIQNSMKIELRATYPKPFFIIKFIPILQGAIIVHLFSQYKISKLKMIDPNNPNALLYESYKEIDISNFNLFFEIEEEDDFFQIKLIETFLFEFFLLLGNNCKVTTDNKALQNSKLMTYKDKEFNLIYLNKRIIKMMKEIMMEYYIDEKDLIYKIKRSLKEENYKNNENQLTEEVSNAKMGQISTSANNNYIDIQNNNITEKNSLEFSYNNFIREFKSIELNYKVNNNDLIGLSQMDIVMDHNFSNINEFSELNLSKENINIVKRNITSKSKKQPEEFNIYSNSNYSIDDSTKIKKIKTETVDYILSTNEPFKTNITKIGYKDEDVSKDESVFKSLIQK